MRLQWLLSFLFSAFCLFLSNVTIVVGMPLYADQADSTYALVLCSGLDIAINSLKSIKLSDQQIGMNSLEANCVSINPCLQTSNNMLPVPIDTWMHGNNSALLLTNSLSQINTALNGQKAHNFGNLDYARIPQGIVLQTCAPAFDVWRETGSVVCNEKTIKTIDTLSTYGCPSQKPFSLLDCIAPLQFDATEVHLHWRASTEIMHFGSETWNEACNNSNHREEWVEVLCTLSRQYSITIPMAAEIGSTSMIKYSFADNFACHTNAELLQVAEPYVLSQYTFPNEMIKCEEKDHAIVYRADDLTCGFTCNTGFDQQGSDCISQCADWQLSCSSGEKHTATKNCAGVTYYQCAECDKLPGQSTESWSADSAVDQCSYNNCEAGTYSTHTTHDCQLCDVNTFTNASALETCYKCNTLQSGLYQSLQGQSSCFSCFSGDTDQSVSCEAGHSYVTDFQRFVSLFDIYIQEGQNVNIETYFHQVCTAGYTCLPCEPGTYAMNNACLLCPLGKYQPNFGTSNCYTCARGQNTTSRGTVSKEKCVCMPGFE